MSSSTPKNDNFNDIFDGFSYDKSKLNSDATKILIVRANYYKEIACELTLGAIVELVGGYYRRNGYMAAEVLKEQKKFERSFNNDNQVLNYEISLRGINLTFATTHGCLELPQIANRVKNDYDIIMFVGCVIRGETTHYETVCGETNRAIMDLSMSSKAVIVNAVLNVESYDQAKARSGFWMKEHQNKGGAAMKAAIKTLDEIKKLGSSSGNDK